MRILVWGTGNIAKQVLHNGIHGRILGFVETEKSKDSFMGYRVWDSDNLPMDYGLIIVVNSFSDQIYQVCKEKNIELGKAVFLIKGKFTDFNSGIPMLEEILGEVNYTNYLAEYSIFEKSFFQKDMEKYAQLNHRHSFAIQKDNLWPVISDKFAAAGAMGNYFWQDLWAARTIVKSGVAEHYDIGSRLDGFIAHLLAAGIKVNMIDIRPFPGEVDNLYTIVDDATMLENIDDNSIGSLSALCSLEHFGLGRYGDSVDPEACFKCFGQIQKKLKAGGNAYISVPIGKERVEFNAHRVFYASTIVECFGGLRLEEFSCAAEGKIEYGAGIHKYDADSHNGEYRYGLFHFVKE